MTHALLYLFLFAFVVLFVVGVVRATYRHEFIVRESFAGLLYHEGRVVETLAPGRHSRWGRDYQLVSLDTRRTLLQVPGQEVLSADNLGIKLSVTLTVQIVDAAKSVLAADSYAAHLYSATQTAIRTVVAGLTLETLLTQRVAIGAQVRELVAPQAQLVGVEIHTLEVRDVMLPGELRKAYNEVVTARQEGQAALERARGETAALRNLANAARLIAGQPALATLRFLQTLEASKASQTLVMNNLSSLLPVFTAREAHPPASDSEET
jgi:regulator of protease activity HflC (stomatin/prohibitin superfamily)